MAKTLEEIAERAADMFEGGTQVEMDDATREVFVLNVVPALRSAVAQERQALREKLVESRPPVEQAGIKSPAEAGWKMATAAVIGWLDSREKQG